MAHNLAQVLFAPKSVALVGQSNDPGKTAGRPLKYLRQAGYAGRIYPVNARRDEHFKRLAKLLGREDWLADPRYVNMQTRVQHREALLAELRPYFETKTSDEWVELLSGIDILKAKVNTYDDLFKDPQVQAVDAVRWVENDTLGRVPMGNLCGQQPLQSGDRLAHAPHVGEHTREILAEMGYAGAEIDGLGASGVVGCYRQST